MAAANSQGCERDEDEWSDDGDDGGTSQAQVSVAGNPCQNISGGGEVAVMISVTPENSTQRVPVDICCTIDISGSMRKTATYEDPDGRVVDDGLSVLDIVRHATKTVVGALGDQDRLAIVAFNDTAHTVLPLTFMTAQGQQAACRTLDATRASHETNMWAGIHASMDVLRDDGASPTLGSRRKAVLVLTDGREGKFPPKGHVLELRDYMDTHAGFTFQLNVFGFGYTLDSQLLSSICKEANGTFAFIPDALIVGTTFVDTVANVLSTLSQSATLSVMPRNGAELTGPVLGACSEFDESWGRAVRLGPLQYGQSREIVVPLRLPLNAPDDQPYLEVVLTYPQVGGKKLRVGVAITDRTPTADSVVAGCRVDVVATGNLAVDHATKNELEVAEDLVAKLRGRLDEAEKRLLEWGETGGMQRFRALRADVDGRMSKGFVGRDRYDRWGGHYVRALMRAHQLQTCTNFMDQGLQHYGGDLFRSLRAAGDRIFLSLPPPRSFAGAPGRPGTGRRARNRDGGAFAAHAGGAAAPAAVAQANEPDMSTYYGGGGGG